MIITNIKIKVTEEEKELIVMLAKRYKMTVNKFMNYVIIKFIESYEKKNAKN